MKPVNLTLSAVAVDAATSEKKCEYSVTYYGVDNRQLLWMEQHIVNSFTAMNEEAAAALKDTAA